jgi:chromosome segregation ATPase
VWLQAKYIAAACATQAAEEATAALQAEAGSAHSAAARLQAELQDARALAATTQAALLSAQQADAQRKQELQSLNNSIQAEQQSAASRHLVRNPNGRTALHGAFGVVFSCPGPELPKKRCGR